MAMQTPTEKACMKWPGQKRTTFDPAEEEKQLKIYIICFRKHADFGAGFPTRKFECNINKYLNEKKFFNAKNNKNKRAKGGTHLTTTHTHKNFYEFGARSTFIIRPKGLEAVNWHTIQRDYNLTIPADARIMTLWLTQRHFERMIASKSYFKLTLKVLNYETEAAWNFKPGMKVRDRVSDYSDVIFLVW